MLFVGQDNNIFATRQAGFDFGVGVAFQANFDSLLFDGLVFLVGQDLDIVAAVFFFDCLVGDGDNIFGFGGDDFDIGGHAGFDAGIL